MKKTLIIWLGLTGLGAVLTLALPEDLLGSQVLFRLSDQHGPTLSNSIGVFVIIAAWLYYLAQLWHRRFQLRAQPLTAWLIATIILSTVLCILAGIQNWNALIALFALIAFAAQIQLGLLAERKTT